MYMQYIHGHACTHNLIDYSRVYSADAYTQMVYNHLLNPVMAFENMTRRQQKLYHSLELALTGIDQKDTNSLPYLLHKDLWERGKTGEVGPSVDYTIPSKTSYVWAVTPFSVNETNSYETVCEDFGYTLEQVEHPWNSLDVHALWEIAKQFNWAQHIADAGISEDIINPTYIYMRWYNNIFKEHYSINDYYDLMGVQ